MRKLLENFKGIRNRLAVFVAVICLFVVIFTFVLQSLLLVPAYYNTLDRTLSRAVDAVSDTLNNDTIPVATQNILALATTGLCIEVSDAETLQLHVLADGLGNQCLLHTGTAGNEIMDEATLLSMRLKATEEGVYQQTYTNGFVDHEQRVFGKHIKETGQVLLVSTNLEQIDIAKGVINNQIFIALAIILPLAAGIAFLFAGFFTAPISKLAEATKQVASGNYDIKLDEERDDELGNLSSDFAAMTTELRRTSRLKDELLANISHDLRTPLTLIKGYAETMRDFTGGNEEKRNEQLDIIINETNRLSGFITDVMELSKQNSGETPIEREPVNFYEFVRAITYREQRLADLKGVVVDLIIPQGNVYINADKRQMDSVLHNLIENAVTHVGEDKTVIVRCEKNANVIKLSVEDHGKGISREDINFIFDRYYRVRDNRGASGSGLGLAIVKSALVRHGYNFGVDSSLGKGSSFWFTVDIMR